MQEKDTSSNFMDEVMVTNENAANVDFDCFSDKEDDWVGRVDAELMMDLIDENSVVAIRAPSNSVQWFYLVKVLSKRVADKVSADGHNIQKGEMYLNGKWISFV